MLKIKICKYIVFIFIFAFTYAYAKVTPCGITIDGITMHGTCKGVLKHGKFVGYYPSGVLAWEVHYKDDKLHGKFSHFYTNGSPHFIGSYKQGVLQGAFVQYGQNDTLLHAYFKKGVLHNWLYSTKGQQKLQALQYYYGKLVAQKYFD